MAVMLTFIRDSMGFWGNFVVGQVLSMKEILVCARKSKLMQAYKSICLKSQVFFIKSKRVVSNQGYCPITIGSRRWCTITIGHRW